MAVSLISLDSDIHCTSASRNEEYQFPKWSDDTLRGLWAFVLNLELLSKSNEDLELQGIVLLLETVFNVFKNLKKKHNETESAYQTMKHDLESTKEDLCRMKEDVRSKNLIPCRRCPELEKELTIQKKKLEHNEQRIKSIVSILNINNSQESDKNTQPGQNVAVAKAYNLVSQMLLDNNSITENEYQEDKNGTKRLRHESGDYPQIRTLGGKRSKPNTETLRTKDRKNDAEILCYGETLVPDSALTDEKDVKKEIIPETLCSQNTAKFYNTEIALDCNKATKIENKDDTESTPKKQVSQVNRTKMSSPILGGSCRKVPHRTTYCNSSILPGGSPTDSFKSNQAPVVCGKSNSSMFACENVRSPSLLKIQSVMSHSLGVVEDDNNLEENEKKEQNISYHTLDKQDDNKKVQADYWKLKPTPSASSRESERKLKQTTLSLARFVKKQDLCTLKEFNGGVRQSVHEDDSSTDKISCDFDEDVSLQLAIQNSIQEKENVNSFLPHVAKTVDENLKLESVGDDDDDDDDFVLTSPNDHSRTSPQRNSGYIRMRTRATRKRDIAAKNANLKKEICPVVRKKDLDETLFVPLFTSTLQDGNYGMRERSVLETGKALSCEQLSKEVEHPIETQGREGTLVRDNDSSFDRIPEKIPTSPNYRYRRDALRKKEARRKLDGWDCEQCKNYYAISDQDSADLKHHLKQCSKHRDKYPVQSSTPPGTRGAHAVGRH
ncbi:uncharacterized protein [Periplaneta americana]|uniref:uncharacterized protein isoform X2 n=1 Tax=Periplaneta americana TaxID=6978 RepID=UPI0037E84353